MPIDFTQINLAENLIDIIFAVIQAIIIALVTGHVLNKIFLKERNMGKNLRECGIERVSASKGTLTARDREKLFGLNGNPVPTEVCLCFITGNAFFRDFQEQKHYIQDLTKQGCKVKVLLANPWNGEISSKSDETGIIKEELDSVTDYYYKIHSENLLATSFLEREYDMLISPILIEKTKDEAKAELKKLLEKESDHNGQVKKVFALLREARKHSANGGDIELHYYTDEYQMPIILAKYNATPKKESKVMLWTNINAPIKETRESINVYAVKNINKKKDFVIDVENSFYYLCRKYPKNVLDETT